MHKKASAILGQEVVAGVQLEAKELVRGAVGNSLVGSLMNSALAGSDVKGASLPGDHKGIIYMAIGADDVAFFSVKQGLFKNSLTQLLAQYPRREVKAVEIEKGLMPTAHILFQDGTNYALKCAKINVKNLKKVQELLTS
jgi:hypothetical protein